MSEPAQSYERHAHRPRLFAAGVALWLIALVLLVVSAFSSLPVRYSLFFLLGSTLCSLFIGRVYITKLQDRIIRMEMRMRCARLLSPAREEDLDRLSMKQIVALRFASDEELEGLLQRTLSENLTPDQIKRAIVRWTPDFDRT